MQLGPFSRRIIDSIQIEQGCEIGLPTRTEYTSFRTHCRWSEALTFHHQRWRFQLTTSLIARLMSVICSYCELPRDAEVRVTLMWLAGPGRHVQLGHASLRLMSNKVRALPIAVRADSGLPSGHANEH